MFAWLTSLLASQASAGDRRCVVVDANGDVVNVVMINPDLPEEEQWVPPEGMRIVESDAAGVGWRVEGSDLVDKRPPPSRITTQGEADVD